MTYVHYVYYDCSKIYDNLWEIDKIKEHVRKQKYKENIQQDNQRNLTYIIFFFVVLHCIVCFIFSHQAIAPSLSNCHWTVKDEECGQEEGIKIGRQVVGVLLREKDNQNVEMRDVRFQTGEL